MRKFSGIKTNLPGAVKRVAFAKDCKVTVVRQLRKTFFCVFTHSDWL